MRILADKVIAEAEAAFAAYGDVELFDGRTLDNKALKKADILLIRSVTPVNEALLAGTPIKFVGTATAGVDHVDRTALAALGIPFTSAPGCNANAVAEFIAASTLRFCSDKRISPADCVVAIIGHGQVGSRVETKLTSLGFECVLNDPPKAAVGDASRYVDLDTALRANIVSLHTPLIVDGDYPSENLIDVAALSAMDNCRLLINAARGGIVDETALLHRLKQDRNFNAQIDCWRDEPLINLELLAATYACSPHVAGHSVEARLNATSQLAAAITKWSAIENPWLSALAPETAKIGHFADIEDTGNGEANLAILAEIMEQCCPIRAIDKGTRALGDQDPGNQARYFDHLRREFGGRREFSFYNLPIAVLNAVGQNTVDALGFRY